jgi:hypothetical protein
LVLLNEEEIERFKNSKKSEDKIPWFTLMLPSGLPAGSPRPGTLCIFRLPPCAGGENLKDERPNMVKIKIKFIYHLDHV